MVGCRIRLADKDGRHEPPDSEGPEARRITAADAVTGVQGQLEGQVAGDLARESVGELEFDLVTQVA